GPELMTASDRASPGGRARQDQAAEAAEAAAGRGAPPQQSPQPQPQSIDRGCGDGVTEPAQGEQCDPAHADGNGVPDSTAEGAAGRGAAAQQARTRQRQSSERGCGEGVAEPAQGEQCDPGDADGNGVPDSTAACDADCTMPVCGDGVVNAGAGEQCDPGDG